MEYIELNGQTPPEKTVAAIGFFDGVHKGHRALLDSTLELAEKRGVDASVITFDVHPRAVLQHTTYLYLTPLSARLRHFEALGFDRAYVIRFTEEKAKLSPKTFISEYLSRLEALVCGFDFTFGARAEGTVETLKSLPLDVIVVDERSLFGVKIGSTSIRTLVQSGQVSEAARYLGRDYCIEGTVVHGDKQGRILSYPTANLETGEYLLPGRGVYATRTRVKDTWYDSMTSVGHNPTLNAKKTLSVETYLLDFEGDLYGRVMSICFVERLRDERSFSSVEALVEAIREDEEKTRELFGRGKGI